MNNRKINFDSKLIAIFIFFSIFMIVQRLNNIFVLIAYFIIGELLLYFYLTIKKISRNAKRLFLIMMFFWFQEFSSAQDNRILSYFVYAFEIILLISLMLYFVQHIRKVHLNQIKVTVLALIALLCVNFIGNLLTYKEFMIFLYSSYDSCKYFILIFYVLAIQPTKKDFKELLDLLIGIVLMHTICAVLQFAGITMFFDIFRGRYDIIQRIGSFRAIGMFPYGIELGNYSCILFALYYIFSKSLAKREKRVYILVEICLVLCIILSGTRTSMANVAILFILSNLDNVISWFKTVAIILMVLLFGSNMIDISEIISRTKWDMSIELPRTYYMKKGIEIWVDNPFFGIGFNTYGSAKYRERTDDIIFDTYDIHKFDYANLATTDSFIVELLPEFGIIGILIIILYGKYIIKNYRKKQSNLKFFSIFIYIIISITIMSINSSTAYINAHIGSWFWIACGMLLCDDLEEYKSKNRARVKIN